MSEENVEIVRGAYQAWERRDMTAVLGACHPDIEWWDRDDVPDPTVRRGLDAVGARFAELDDVWIGLGLEPREFIDASDFVVVMFSLTGRGRVSGAAIEAEEVQVFRLQNGKIIELREYSGKADALKAIRLAGKAMSGQRRGFVISGFRDGTFREVRSFPSWSEALEAAGLEE
jgi:ketosteroid isomerase-like protein